MIQINKAVSKKDINKISNANNIFNLMKAEVKQKPELNKFVLDFQEIKTCSKHVFKEIFRLMNKNLDGKYVVELVNAGPGVAMSFNIAVSGK